MNYIGIKLDGRYEIKKLIGDGGMADVYLADDLLEYRKVAVKILKTEYADNKEFLTRFRNESRAVASMSHPNIVRIFDVGFVDTPQYIVMEYVEGITLKEYMNINKRLSWQDTVHFCIQILRALDHAHNKGVVHRDIKPQNIMLLPDGTVKVMDFGIATIARDEILSPEGKTIGTAHYMSPEQAKGYSATNQSDVYSCGIMLYEMLTGVKPFDNENPNVVVGMHLSTVPEKVTDLNPNVPKGLEEIALKAMEKNTTDRYKSATEMLEDFDALKNDINITFGYAPKYPNQGGANILPTNSRRENFDEEIKVKEFYEDELDYEDEDEEIEEEAKSLFVPILSAVTVVVIIAAVFFVVSLFNGVFGQENKADTKYTTVPNLVGMNYEQAIKNYPDLKIVMAEDSEFTKFQAGTIYDQSVKENKKIKTSDEIIVKVSKGAESLTVPSVAGFEFSVACDTLKNAGLEYKERFEMSDQYERNYAIKTVPEAGTPIESGTVVELYISMGKNQVDVQVPNFVGQNIEAAKNNATYLALAIQEEIVESDQPEGTVLWQSNAAGSSVPAATVITLRVSNGTAPAGAVTINFAIPSGYTGSYKFNLYMNGSVVKSSSTFNSESSANVSATIENSGVKDVTVELVNVGTSKNVKVGVYSVDFTAKTYRAMGSIPNAFKTVGTKKATTTTKAPVVTPKPTTPTQTPTNPPTEPPAPTDPPVTDPPSEE
ncbi:MAG: Stk1 family PASTA domain-containing Ser/Thr kinase [Ruminococcus sp.]|nr:Stk1 family PASTA domain-containing Ser/Thr kinase [Ruminococcus sp.]